MTIELGNQQDIIKSICTHYNLGQPIKLLTQITGGLLHKMWKLEAEKGIFAIKELNAEIMKRPNLILEMNQSEKITNEFKNLGIGAVCGLEIDGQYVFESNKKFFIVYPWINGEVLKKVDQVTIEIAKKISSTLANIHKINLKNTKSTVVNLSLVDSTLWSSLKDKVLKTEYTWTSKCLNFIDSMGTWSSLSNLAITNINNIAVLSHGDMDMKNVIWDNKNNPQIIDWESSGLTIPIVELVKLALDWSGEAEGKANEIIFKEIFKTYTEIHNNIDLTEVKDALYISISDFLGWLEINLKRALQIIKCDQNELDIANIEIPKTIDILNSRLKSLDEYASWLKIAD